MVAHLLPKQRAAGSNPVSRSSKKPTEQSVGFVVVVSCQLRWTVVLFERFLRGYSPAAMGYHSPRTIHKLAKFASSFRPAAWLFSGWNWVAAMLPCSMTETKGPS